jgi:hypothetical protein
MLQTGIYRWQRLDFAVNHFRHQPSFIDGVLQPQIERIHIAVGISCLVPNT